MVRAEGSLFSNILLSVKLYLYRALVAGRHSHEFQPHRQCFYVSGYFMRPHLLLIFLLTSILTFGQKSASIIVPKDDGSPFTWQTKHLWLGRSNPITSDYIGENQFLKLWTDNGRIDTGDFYLTNYAIKPERTGIVNIYSIQKVWNGTNYDTIQTQNTFTAITPPKIIVKLKSDRYNKDTTIAFELIDSLTTKRIGKRYKIGRFFDPEILDNNGTLIGRLSMCSGTEINLNDPIHKDSTINFAKGYKIKFAITIRDMQTDLLIPTSEFLYTIR